MSLRKSPTRTPAMLAALRSNCLKSTGPRTARGKARSCLNALKHGQYARRLPEKLMRAGYYRGAALYRYFQQEIAATFGASTPQEWRQAERLAAEVWRLAQRVEGLRTKLESLLESEGKWTRVQPDSRIETEDPAGVPSAETDSGPTVQMQFKIVNRLRRVGLVFWVQQRRYWSMKRVVNVLLGLESEDPPAGRQLEERWRRKRFRSRKLGLCERVALEKQARRDSR